MRLLAPKKFKTKEDFKIESLTLKEFSTLMAGDVVGDRIVKAIHDEVLAKRARKARLAKKQGTCKASHTPEKTRKNGERGSDSSRSLIDITTKGPAPLEQDDGDRSLPAFTYTFD